MDITRCGDNKYGVSCEDPCRLAEKRALTFLDNFDLLLEGLLRARLEDRTWPILLQDKVWLVAFAFDQGDDEVFSSRSADWTMHRSEGRTMTSKRGTGIPRATYVKQSKVSSLKRCPPSLQFLLPMS